MLDFGVSPPEITSGKMYSGPGSGSMMAAGTAWAGLAAELDTFAQGYLSAISALQSGGWSGPASEAMAVAAAPYAQWAATTAVQAGQAASQARAAAAAFETAHTAITPPAVVAANRTQLAHLIATNILGQNTAHIATTEAAYDAMWMHNTQTMFGYATSASSATQVSPFTQPPPTTNPAGQSAASAAAARSAAGSGASQSQTLSQLISALLQPAASSSGSAAPSLFGLPISQSMLDSIGNLNTLDGPISFAMAGARTIGNLGTMGIAGYRFMADAALYAPLAGLTGATSPVTFGALPSAGLAGAVESAAGGVNRAVLASAGTAGPVGQLSVPRAWADIVPEAAVTEDPLWLSDAEASLEADTAGLQPAAGIGPIAGMAGVAAAGMIGRPVVSNMLRVAPSRFKMPRHSAGG
jgi:PPE-repeat protein